MTSESHFNDRAPPQFFEFLIEQSDTKDEVSLLPSHSDAKGDVKELFVKGSLHTETRDLLMMSGAAEGTLFDTNFRNKAIPEPCLIMFSRSFEVFDQKAHYVSSLRSSSRENLAFGLTRRPLSPHVPTR